MIAARIANMKSGARTDLEPRTNLSEVDNQTASELLNVGTTTLKSAKAVIKTGSPELITAVDSGEIKSRSGRAIRGEFLPLDKEFELSKCLPVLPYSHVGGVSLLTFFSQVA